MTPAEAAAREHRRADRLERSGDTLAAFEARTKARRLADIFTTPHTSNEGTSAMTTSTTPADLDSTYRDQMDELAGDLARLLGVPLAVADRGPETGRARYRIENDSDPCPATEMTPLGPQWHRKHEMLDVLRSAVAAARLVDHRGQRLAAGVDDALVTLNGDARLDPADDIVIARAQLVRASREWAGDPPTPTPYVETGGEVRARG